MHRVAEHAFNRVRAQKLKESRCLDACERGMLLGRTETVDALDLLQSFTIDLGRGLLSLIALLGNAVLERRLRIAVAIASVWTGELAVDIDHHAGFVGAGS